MRYAPSHAGFLVLASLLSLSIPAQATRWDVRADGSGDAATIQAAIDLAAPGDSVVLAPGTYHGPGNRDVSFHGKNLVVVSSAGRDVTIIDCEGAGRAFIFNSGEPGTARLEELTIKNGLATFGGGVYMSNGAHALVHRCVITQCHADRGGGVYCGDQSIGLVSGNVITGNSAIYGGGVSDDNFCESHIQFNTIEGNTASQYGGGVYSENGGGVSYFENNTIDGNSAASGGGVAVRGFFVYVSGNRIRNNTGLGAGVYVTQGGSFLDDLIAGNLGVGIFVEGQSAVDRCTIVGNTSHGVVADNASVALKHSIVAFNVGSGVVCTVPSGEKATIDCCDIFGNGGGTCAKSATNLFGSDPFFCTTSGEGAYYLASNSPCAPAQSPCGVQIGAYPVGCDMTPIPVFVHCPPDTVMPQGPTFTLATLQRFTIVNDSNQPATLEYDVSSSGPAILLDGGNAASLAGTTALLAPGETFQPPAAQLVVGNVPPFSQGVTCHVHRNAPAVDTSCSTLVTFQQPVATAFSPVRAELSGHAVHLTWTAHHDVDISEIIVRRAVAGREINPSVLAHLASTAVEYIDQSAGTDQTVEYVLYMMAGDELVAQSAPVRVHMPALTLALTSISPNPFRASTRIAFDVPADATVTMEVFDVAGRRVRTLLRESMPAGGHETTWNEVNGGLASGVYFVRLVQGKATSVRKVTVIQ